MHGGEARACGGPRSGYNEVPLLTVWSSVSVKDVCLFRQGSRVLCEVVLGLEQGGWATMGGVDKGARNGGVRSWWTRCGDGYDKKL